VTAVQAPDRAQAAKIAKGRPIGEARPRASQDAVVMSGATPPAGWTEVKVPKGGTLAALSLGSQDLADAITKANLGRPEWTRQVKNRPDGPVGWIMGLFGVKETRPEPKFGRDEALPEGAGIWLPRELDPAATAPPGFRHVAIPAGRMSLEALTGGDAAWSEAIGKANPDMSAGRLADGALYLNLPEDLPLENGRPVPPDAGHRAPQNQMGKLIAHIAHDALGREADAVRGTLKVKPGDTLADLAKVVFNDARRWEDLKPARAGELGPGDDLAARGLTYVQLPETYAAPDWGDIAPLKPENAFLKKLAPAAARIEEKYGIPAAVILAQAAIESASGESTIGDFNCFGIKGEGSRGSILARTAEYRGGQRYATQAYFADYGSWDEALEAHAEVLQKPRYAEAMQHKHDPIGFARALQGKYATDPRYAEKLIETMREQNLL
jgi:hypothetical protein